MITNQEKSIFDTYGIYEELYVVLIDIACGFAELTEKHYLEHLELLCQQFQEPIKELLSNN